VMEHLTIQANGAAFHVARIGQRRPLLLLHGWPEGHHGFGVGALAPPSGRQREAPAEK
jgi:pimeloyl-ACP methyl ester carboxylesterase